MAIHCDPYPQSSDPERGARSYHTYGVEIHEKYMRPFGEHLTEAFIVGP